jgi:alpha-tubulin suppressor-like RCC1 family protein
VVIKPQPHQRLEKAIITNNNLEIIYEEKEKAKEKMPKDPIKSYFTVGKEYNVENGKLFECRGHMLRQLKLPNISERVLELSCGANHTILRTSARKVYTFGSGKHGQLGHGNFHSA